MIYLILILQLIYALAIFVAYRAGVADGYKIYKGEPVVEERKRKVPPKPPDRDEIIRRNIENYTGSGEGQQEYDV